MTMASDEPIVRAAYSNISGSAVIREIVYQRDGRGNSRIVVIVLSRDHAIAGNSPRALANRLVCGCRKPARPFDKLRVPSEVEGRAIIGRQRPSYLIVPTGRVGDTAPHHA